MTGIGHRRARRASWPTGAGSQRPRGLRTPCSVIGGPQVRRSASSPLQGAFRATSPSCATSAPSAVEVRTPADLDGVDAWSCPAASPPPCPCCSTRRACSSPWPTRLRRRPARLRHLRRHDPAGPRGARRSPDQRSFGVDRHRRPAQRLRPSGRQLRGRPRRRGLDRPFHAVFIRAPVVVSRAGGRGRPAPHVVSRAGHRAVARAAHGGACRPGLAASTGSAARSSPELTGDPTPSPARARSWQAREGAPMSGHSKWATIKHKKGAADKARGKLFAKLIRQVEVAARDGGGDLEANADAAHHVRQGQGGVGAHRHRSSGPSSAAPASSRASATSPITYEGYAPERRRRAASRRSPTTATAPGPRCATLFSKNGGSIAEPGAVAWQFERKGIVLRRPPADEDDLMLVALDAGADDIVDEGDAWRVTCRPDRPHRGPRRPSRTRASASSAADLTMQPKPPWRLDDGRGGQEGPAAHRRPRRPRRRAGRLRQLRHPRRHPRGGGGLSRAVAAVARPLPTSTLAGADGSRRATPLPTWPSTGARPWCWCSTRATTRRCAPASSTPTRGLRQPSSAGRRAAGPQPAGVASHERFAAPAVGSPSPCWPTRTRRWARLRPPRPAGLLRRVGVRASTRGARALVGPLRHRPDPRSADALAERCRGRPDATDATTGRAAQRPDAAPARLVLIEPRAAARAVDVLRTLAAPSTSPKRHGQHVQRRRPRDRRSVAVRSNGPCPAADRAAEPTSPGRCVIGSDQHGLSADGRRRVVPHRHPQHRGHRLPAALPAASTSATASAGRRTG